MTKRAWMLCLALLAAGCGGPLYDGAGQNSPNHGCSDQGCPVQLLADEGVENLPAPGSLVATSDEIAWIDSNGGPVLALGKDGGPPLRQFGFGMGNWGAARLVANASGKLFWLDQKDNWVDTYDEDSAKMKTLAEISTTSSTDYASPPLAVHGTELFWFDHATLTEKDTTTSALPEAVATTPGRALSLLADGKYAYWSDWPAPDASTGGEIRRVDLATGEVTVLASGLDLVPRRMAQDADFLYLLLFEPGPSSGRVARISKNGGDVQTLAEAHFLFQEEDLAVDDAYVYFTDDNHSDTEDYTGRVVRVPKAGGDLRILAEHQLRPGAIAVSSEAVYWATNDGKISRVLKP